MKTTDREKMRLAAVDSLGLVGAARPDVLDSVTRVAASVFDAPMSSVTLVHEDQQWFAGSTGLAEPGTSRAASFSARLIDDPRPLVVPDTRDDPSTRFLPHVNQVPPIRFYAGVPVLDADGQVLGSVAVFDRVPRLVSPARLELLQGLGRLAAAHLQSFRDRRQLSALSTEVDRLRVQEDDTVATVSHELRTPVSSMLGYLEMVAEQPAAGPHQNAIEAIRHSGHDLITMLESLLAAERRQA